jgi:hypothetical protein
MHKYGNKKNGKVANYGSDLVFSGALESALQ